MNTNMSGSVKKLTFSALFLALALVLALFNRPDPQIGKMLAPMHIPVLLCGFVCGWALWAGGGLCVAAAALSPLLHAAHLSGRAVHGL